MMIRRTLPPTILLGLLLLCTAGCALGGAKKTEMHVLLAGSLMVPFDHLERAFEEAFPDVDVLMDGHGSIQCVRHVTELEHLADVVAVADHALIPMLMYETENPETGEPYASWTLQFATNRLGVAYTPQSAHAGEIDADNWYRVLSRPGVLVGLADPRFDACGYRSLMTAQLSTGYYDDGTIFYNLWGQRFSPPLRVEPGEGNDTILVPEVLQPKEDGEIVMRGSSVRLLALLQTGDIDYAFEYESVAHQHGLEYLALPPEIDLSDETYQDTYDDVQVVLDYRRFASVKPQFVGAPISYGITIPSNAPHPDLAAEFIQFLLGPEGQAIMADNQHPLTLPPPIDNPDALPDRLRPLVQP